MMLPCSDVIALNEVPQMAVTNIFIPRSVPVFPSLSWGLSVTRRLICLRLLSNHYFCVGTQSVKFYAFPLRAVHFSYSYLVLPNISPASFKDKCFQGSSCQCKTPSLGCLMWSLVPVILVEDLYNCEIPLVCGSLTQRYGSSPIPLTPPSTYLIKVLSLYIQLWKIFYVSHWIILIDYYSEAGCKFGMHMGNEFGIFLIYHVGHNLHISTQSSFKYSLHIHQKFYGLICTSKFGALQKNLELKKVSWEGTHFNLGIKLYFYQKNIRAYIDFQAKPILQLKQQSIIKYIATSAARIVNTHTEKNKGKQNKLSNFNSNQFCRKINCLLI